LECYATIGQQVPRGARAARRGNQGEFVKTTWKGIRLAASVLCAALVGAIPAQSQDAPEPEVFGGPLANLSEQQLSDFLAGDEEFRRVFTPETGLGPVFNGNSCLMCHSEGGVGGGSSINVTRFGLLDAKGKFDPLTELGGSLLQSHGIDPLFQEVVPPEANIVAQRRSTPLFGLGLIEAIPDATILNNLLGRKAMGVTGRAAYVIDPVTGEKRVGRFGWKSQHATLLAFAGDASMNELGISNHVFRLENVPNGASLAASEIYGDVEDRIDEATGKSGVDRLADFMRLLSEPKQLPFTTAADAGERWFIQAGCQQCHLKVMFTGKSDIAALDRKPVFLFSDLLLHDMGSLGDGIAQGDAGPRELRTSPLWGLRMQSSFLHDGRATTLVDSILMHDGEAAPSVYHYLHLPEDQQQELLEFLRSI
jgi:CxxC motif-containing protein (DUF1111 family)